MAHYLGQHAVVIGGSLAGLMTARVLADHFDAVTVLERDVIDAQPGMHKSIPQGNHLHGLLRSGQQVMASLYPGFLDKLDTLGARRCRAGTELVFYLPNGKAFSATGTVRAPYDLGFDITCHSRGLLEYCVRQCTLEYPNITFASEMKVQGLLYADGRVHGVRYQQCGEVHSLAADFVVDAGGRGSQAPRWLMELGFQAPQETVIGVDIAYASTKFCVPATYDEPDRIIACLGLAPDFPNGAMMEIIEENLWHVTLVGRFGNYPPHDAEGFVAFAQALYTPKVYDLVKDAERVTDITSYRFPTSVLRHYERLRTFPERLVVLGDAISSFNPFYGQGMSSAALQVEALQQLLHERATASQGLDGLAQAFFPQAAAIVLTPWTLAARQDWAFPRTQGDRPADLEEDAQYFAALDALTADDVEVYRLLVDVFHLVKPLSALHEEPLRSRVVARQQNQGGQESTSAAPHRARWESRHGRAAVPRHVVSALK
jgi:2-polyprenyl-6-methoxyphenol hydroxylase-like FAD-dependent oxidoreductase